MSSVGQWIGVVGDVASIGGSIWGGVNSYNRGRRQDALSAEQNQRQRYFFDRLKTLEENPNSIYDDPGFKSSVAQGEEALRRSASSSGLTGSGNAATELQRYARASSMDYMMNLKKLYASLAGGNINPAGAASSGTETMRQGYDQVGDALASLGYMFGSNRPGEMHSANNGSYVPPDTMDWGDGYIVNLPSSSSSSGGR